MVAAGSTVVPSRVTDWGTTPNAAALFPATLRTLIDGPAPNLTGLPRNQFDWRLTPAAYYASNLRTWTYSPQSVGLSFIPGRVVEWGTPDRPYFQPPWVATNVAIRAAIAATPRNQYDWPVPQDNRRIGLTWLRGVTAGTVVQQFMPSRVVEWGIPNRIYRDSSLLTWINQRVTFQYVFRGPLIAPRYVPTPLNYWTAPLNVALLTTAPPTRPVNQYQWPLPILATRGALTWTQSPNFAAQVAFIPCRVTDWGTVSSVQRPIDWVSQSNVALYSTTAAKPINQIDWPVPVAPSRRDPSFVTGTSVALRVTPAPSKPVNQSDWPLPVYARQLPPSWTQSPNFAVQAFFMPCRVVDWGFPTPIQVNPTAWTFTSQFLVPFVPPPPPPPPVDTGGTGSWPFGGRGWEEQYDRGIRRKKRKKLLAELAELDRLIVALKRSPKPEKVSALKVKLDRFAADLSQYVTQPEATYNTAKSAEQLQVRADDLRETVHQIEAAIDDDDDEIFMLLM